MRRKLEWSVLLGAIIGAGLSPTGCGGGSASTPPPFAVAITPGAAQTIDQGQAQNFTAVVSNDPAGKGVTWTVSGSSCSGAACGTLTNITATSVAYNAPASLSSNLTVTVTASSVSDSTKSTSVMVTVLALTLSVSPASADIAVRGTQQFIVTANNDASNKGVTWTLTQGGAACSPACGTVSPTSTTSGSPTTYTAPASAPSPATVTVTATSVSDTSKSATAMITVQAVSVSVSPTSTSVPVNTTLQFSATVMFDATNSGVTWSLTQGGTPCSPGCGALNSNTGNPVVVDYAAPAAVPNAASVTVTAISIADPTRSASATITITASNPNNANLNGQYAFLLSGFDANGAVAIAGSFTADGAGGIFAGGVEDINRTTGVISSVAITGGSYSVFADNRGTLTLTTSLGSSAFRFALCCFQSGTFAAAELRIIEFDTSGTRVTGVGLLQDPTAFSAAQISGDFAFGGSGADFTGGRFGIAGRFSASGGNITNGEFDANGLIGGDLGGPSVSMDVTGTYAVTAPNGRGTLQLIVPIPFTGTSFTLNFSVYVVSANELLFISTDPRNTASEPLSSGQVLRQSPSPAAFSRASLNGISVENDTGVEVAGGSDVEVGLLTTDGAGNFAFSTDENNSGVILGPTNLTGNYSVDPNGLGRVTLRGAGNLPILYLVSQNQGFVLFTDSRVETGSFEPQTPGPPGGWTSASFGGSFSLGVITPAIPAVSMNSGMLFNPDSVSTFDVTQDSNEVNALLPDQAIAYSYSVSANGRITTGSGSAIGYIVSGLKAVFLDAAAGKNNAAVFVIENNEQASICCAVFAGAELFNSSIGTFTGTGSMAVVREGRTATPLQDGKVSVTGAALITGGTFPIGTTDPEALPVLR